MESDYIAKHFFDSSILGNWKDWSDENGDTSSTSMIIQLTNIFPFVLNLHAIKASDLKEF